MALSGRFGGGGQSCRSSAYHQYLFGRYICSPCFIGLQLVSCHGIHGAADASVRIHGGKAAQTTDTGAQLVFPPLLRLVRKFRVGNQRAPDIGNVAFPLLNHHVSNPRLVDAANQPQRNMDGLPDFFRKVCVKCLRNTGRRSGFPRNIQRAVGQMNHGNPGLFKAACNVDSLKEGLSVRLAVRGGHPYNYGKIRAYMPANFGNNLQGHPKPPVNSAAVFIHPLIVQRRKEIPQQAMAVTAVNFHRVKPRFFCPKGGGAKF